MTLGAEISRLKNPVQSVKAGLRIAFGAVHWATGSSYLDTFLSAALNSFELIEKFSRKFRDKN
jgi:hypothetical protein